MHAVQRYKAEGHPQQVLYYEWEQLSFMSNSVGIVGLCIVLQHSRLAACLKGLLSNSTAQPSIVIRHTCSC